MSFAIRVSAPGSIMVTGEHAVVYGAPAIVCAIEQRIYITATPISEAVLEINSEIASPKTYALDALPSDGPYKFVVRAVSNYAARLPHGLRLDITSQIDPTLGLGSSAAVTVAVLGVLAKLTQSDHARDWKNHLHSEALTIVRDLQRRGSGADLGASLFGGLLAYQLPSSMLAGMPIEGDAAEIADLGTPPAMGLSYCGYKTPTGEVLAKIAQARVGHEATFDDLYEQMGACAQASIEAAKSQDWAHMGELLNTYQSLMTALGVSDAALDAIIAEAKLDPAVLAAKISGSGLGDCVLAFGHIPKGFTPVKFAQTGLHFHD